MPDSDCFSKKLGPYFQKAARIARDGGSVRQIAPDLAKAVVIAMRSKGFAMPMLRSVLQLLSEAIKNYGRSQMEDPLFFDPRVARQAFIQNLDREIFDHIGSATARLVEHSAIAAFSKLTDSCDYSATDTKVALFDEVGSRLLGLCFIGPATEGISMERGWGDDAYCQFGEEVIKTTLPPMRKIFDQVIGSPDGKPTRVPRQKVVPVSVQELHEALEEVEA